MVTSLSPLHSRMADPRARSLRMILGKEGNIAEEEAAEIKSGMAVSMWQAGKNEHAMKLATQSLEIHRNQWLPHRIIMDVMMARQQYDESYAYLMEIKVTPTVPAWDEAMSYQEFHLCAAACQWHLKEWEKVNEHLCLGFPDGVESMPVALQEDWFKLALYRHQPDDAAEAAALLVTTNTLEFTDALLQTLVQQGWTGQALPLYRTIYAKDPRNELLRRRLVALCIREGEIEEARKLTESGALNLNP